MCKNILEVERISREVFPLVSPLDLAAKTNEVLTLSAILSTDLLNFYTTRFAFFPPELFF